MITFFTVIVIVIVIEDCECSVIVLVIVIDQKKYTRDKTEVNHLLNISSCKLLVVQ